MRYHLQSQTSLLRPVDHQRRFNFHTAAIVLVFVLRCYEIGCLRYLLRGRKKEDTVVTSRSGERNELYHTAGISIGKRVPREKTSALALTVRRSSPLASLRSCQLRCSTFPGSSAVVTTATPRSSRFGRVRPV